MKKQKSRNKKKKSGSPEINVPHALLVDESAGERLFMIVDFAHPGDNYIRRIISKRLADGRIQAATYHGPVDADGLCSDKQGLMWMTATEEKFLAAVKLMESVYRIRGASITIKNMDGKSLEEVAEIFRKYDFGKVMDEAEAVEYIKAKFGGGGLEH